MKRHLDLGCGLRPRNPYLADLTFGCDLRAIDGEVEDIGFVYKRVNLIVEPIPFPNNYFHSVSAYDFLEHIPRQTVLPNGGVCNPFVDLMSEIHRVLAPGGRLLALTPAYPHQAAFSDPTHVNIITEETHKYFTGEEPSGVIYGFKGRFDIIQVNWEASANAYSLQQSGLRKMIRRTHRKIFNGGLSHLLWELKAVKD